MWYCLLDLRTIQIWSSFNSIAYGRFNLNFVWVNFKLISMMFGWSAHCEFALRWVSLDITFSIGSGDCLWHQAMGCYLSQCFSRYCCHMALLDPYELTHWGRVTQICVGIQTIIGSDNGLSHGRRQAIIWTSAGIVFTGPLGTNFSEILIRVQTFSFKKMHLKIASAKWRPFCPGLDVLTQPVCICVYMNERWKLFSRKKNSYLLSYQFPLQLNQHTDGTMVYLLPGGILTMLTVLLLHLQSARVGSVSATRCCQQADAEPLLACRTGWLIQYYIDLFVTKI